MTTQGSRRASALAQFVDEAARVSPNAELLKELHRKVLQLLAMAQPEPWLAGRIDDGLCQVRRLIEARERLWLASVIECQRKGWPTVDELTSRTRQVLDDLSTYAQYVKRNQLRPGGYSATELKDEAEIGKGLWQRIVQASSVRPTEPGDQARRFSNAEIRKLASAADEEVGTLTARRAADRWLELIGDKSVAATPAVSGA